MQIPTEVNEEIKYLLEASGFVYNDSLKFEAVHCQPQKGHSLQQNGFYQTYLTSDDVGYCRVTIFPKGKLSFKKLQKKHFINSKDQIILAVEASLCYFFENWLMKLKCPKLRNMQIPSL